jgi:flagellar basal body rod protein FlgG
MIAMIEAARVLEANVNMIKTQDEMISALVNRVLSV